MLIAVIVLQVLILLVLCVIARRLPKQTNVVSSFGVGAGGAFGGTMALSQVKAAAAASKRAGAAC